MTDWNLKEETFDPSWSYNFKWGYDNATRQVHVWRVEMGTNGGTAHRQELEVLMGRPPKTSAGDILGLAQFMPIEKKLDGTVVAPAVITVEAYYGSDIPQAVFDYFESKFEGAVARRASINSSPLQKQSNDWDAMFDGVADEGAGEENIIKWVYGDPEGLLIFETDEDQAPTHDQAAQQAWGRRTIRGKDFWGYAIPVSGNRVEVETGRFDTSLKILQEVKAELSKMFPESEILLPHVREDHEQLGVEFSGNPDINVDHAASAKWANQHLEDNSDDGWIYTKETVSPASVRALRHLLSLKVKEAPLVKQAEADMEGAMIAVFIPERVGEKIKIEGGEPVEMMHITLCYFEDKGADRDDWDEVEQIVQRYAQKYPVLKGEIGGYGVFSNEEPVLWASPAIPQLAELRYELYTACNEAGFTVSDKFGWAPHITLAYNWDDDLPKLDAKIPVELEYLRFAKGDKGVDHKFTGAIIKQGNDDWGSYEFEQNDPWTGTWKDGTSMSFGPQTWSGWKGAHRFVTDGKEVVSENEENLRWNGKGWHGLGHYGLEQEFDDLHHDPDRRRAQLGGGWAVPTIDGGGYGVLSWGFPEGPQLQDTLALLQKHLGKPTHSADLGTLANPRLYQAYPEGGNYVRQPKT